MPAPTLAGTATIKGLQGATATWTGITATVTPISGDLTHNMDVEELKDGDGNIVTLGAANPTEEVQLELFLTGASVAVAKTLVKPTMLQIITIAAFPYTEMNGTYNYVSGFNVKLSENFAKVSLRLKRFAGAALAVI